MATMPDRLGTLVVLTWPELFQAAMVGAMRQASNLRDGLKDRYGADPTRAWDFHVEGACGEMAVAKYLGEYWSGAVGNRNARDVGGYQVRTSAYAEAPLMLHPSDPDDQPFVLVVGRAPRLRIVGYLPEARLGKRQEYWRDPAGLGRQAYCVPQEHLKPLVTCHTFGGDVVTQRLPKE